MGKGIFITATGTDIGKTYVTALLVKKLREAGLNAGYYKAALSGAEPSPNGLVPGDAAFVAKTAGLTEAPNQMVSYIYEEAVSPHLAAQREGNPVELAKVAQDYARSLEKYDYVTVEGSGGIICPIRWDEQHILLEDIIKELKLGALVVTNATLGSINALVLTTYYLQEHQIPVRGIILNNFDETSFMQADNKKMIEAISGYPVIGIVRPEATEIEIDLKLLQGCYK